jgi:hypothetical protein
MLVSVHGISPSFGTTHLASTVSDRLQTPTFRRPREDALCRAA